MASALVDPVDLARAEIERRKRRRRSEEAATVQPPPFGQWLAENDTKLHWTAPHFRAIQSKLDAITLGHTRRCIIEAPVRHGKSQHNTFRYPAYRLKYQPTRKIIIASYAEKKAQAFSRNVRRWCARLGIPLSKERNAAGEWETAAGGVVTAIGVGSGTASVDADDIYIDDAVGARKNAESAAMRQATWDWFTSDIAPRMQPHTCVLVSGARYHQDDFIGRLKTMQGGLWDVLTLPAIADKSDALGRPFGAPLWPEMYPLSFLEEQRIATGTYAFAALYLCAPRPREGGMFQYDWWKVLGDVPHVVKAVRYWDLAGTQPKDGKHDPDYTAGTLWGRMEDQRACILHQAAFRKGVADRDAMLEQIARQDLAQYRGRLSWWIETEAGIAGEDRTAAIVRRLNAIGLTVHTERPTGSKVMRAEPLQSAAEAGNVLLAPDDPTNPWHDAFRLEASDFPTGTHDDRVDSAAGGFNKLAVSHSASLVEVTF